MGDWTATTDGGYTYTPDVFVTIRDDDEHERDEKFRYFLDSTPGVPSAFHIDKTKRIATILDNDPLRVEDKTDSMMRVTSTSTTSNGYYDDNDTITFTVPFNRQRDGDRHAAAFVRPCRTDPPGGLRQRLRHERAGHSPIR